MSLLALLLTDGSRGVASDAPRAVDPDARFEYRVFAERLPDVAQRLCELAAEEGERESREETYLVGPRPDRNVKVHHGAIDVKALREERHGLERWEPLPEVRLPVAGGWVRRPLAELLGVEPLRAPGARYDLDALVAEVIEPTRGLASVRVRKRRRRFSHGELRAELTDVEISGPALGAGAEDVRLEGPAESAPVRLETAAVESTSVRDVSEWVRRLALDRWPNTSFVRRLQQELVGR